ncbi:HAD family phosphatase [Deinococcus metallilatus]|uniref:HAD family phosphatase n=1 Tax=Deinococcus metallilatus TaxID=1211322 RepID=A0AAJ5F2B9_9DEIO|nr:HAD family phosphatase [Deinococcus metallilatus]MBB5295976.1 putative hydrolase of the HAD superfamily [Deinococcus metallilatus]QBY08201.1 HAD family phosphatase [Deinococcus metallilatus]RXJ11932.1 HAD family phosphatase [Deinococcus metallilatus]TLK25836.1 HAD family phosphatase [Deinococcus metallilatus]GMA14489.1 hydrolase [Deinococcus metallilatus]
MTIRAVFWDIGGVLLTNGWDREQRAEVVARFGLDAEDFAERHKLAVPELERGRMSLAEYLDQTIFHTGRAFTPQDFRAAMEAVSQPQAETLAFARDLGQRWRMYSLNNEGRDLNEYRIRTYRLDEFLLAFFTSCYLGLLKPNPAMYRLALDLAHVRPEEAVMVDDRPQNAEAARSVGMHAVRYQNAAQLRAELAALGVE